ncbi:hypothetical protein [Geothrix fermentans]|uniref:hypothetical protein n=1 Tax=Geothrix fermentans TaxID=44676 RepID=UPI000427BF4B|nr:hypothetical protein [Geothrix fermentans]
MFAVLLLFLVPVGGGIPAGVLLAQSKGLGWAPTAGLYLVSDVILALAFEPVLRGLVFLARRSPFLARFRSALKAAMALSAARVGGPGMGPIALVMIAFGVDPMTGPAAPPWPRAMGSWRAGPSPSRGTCSISPWWPSRPCA